MRILKYLISGGIGVSVNLGILFVLVDVLGMHYLAGSIGAVSLSTFVGFLLQKYWTFKENSKNTAHTQFFMYALVALFNIGLNTLIVLTFVDVFHFNHLVAQLMGAATVAVSSYIIYKKIIFRNPPPVTV